MMDHLSEQVRPICSIRVIIVQIGRAHVWTPVTVPYLVCRLLLEKKNHNWLRKNNSKIEMWSSCTTHHACGIVAPRLIPRQVQRLHQCRFGCSRPGMFNCMQLYKQLYIPRWFPNGRWWALYLSPQLTYQVSSQYNACFALVSPEDNFQKKIFLSSLHSQMKIIRLDSLKLMVAYGKYANADNSFINIEQTTPTSNKLPLPSSLAAVLTSLCWLADAFCTLGEQLQASWGRTNLHQIPNVAFSDSSYHSILMNEKLSSVQTLHLFKILWLENKATQN